MVDSEIREVYLAQDMQEAHFIKAMLQDAGIGARVVEDRLLGALGDLPAAAIGPRVWVCAEDADKARNVIEQWQQRRQAGDQDRETWTCNSCGERNEPAFELCWNCQAER